MSKYSYTYDNKVLDFSFKSLGGDVYLFKIGNTTLGTLHRIHKSWASCSVFPGILKPVYGFKTRLKAAEFLIQMFEFNQSAGLKGE